MVARGVTESVFCLVDCVSNELPRVLVLQSIKDARSIVSSHDDATQAQLRKVLGYRGWRLVDDIGEVIDRELPAVMEGEDDANASRIGEHAEHLNS